MNAIKAMVSVICLANILLNVPRVSGQQASSGPITSISGADDAIARPTTFEALLGSDFRGNAVRLPNLLANFQPAQAKESLLRPGKMFLTGYSAPIRRLQFSADGKTLATGGIDRNVTIWDFDRLLKDHARK